MRLEQKRQTNGTIYGTYIEKRFMKGTISCPFCSAFFDERDNIQFLSENMRGERGRKLRIKGTIYYPAYEKNAYKRDILLSLLLRRFYVVCV